MIVRCRFCGHKIRPETEVCEHCNKTLKATSEAHSSGGAIDIDSWQEKTVPAWVMYLAILGGIGCLVLMYSRGCDQPQLEDDVSRSYQGKIEINDCHYLQA